MIECKKRGLLPRGGGVLATVYTKLGLEVGIHEDVHIRRPREGSSHGGNVVNF